MSHALVVGGTGMLRSASLFLASQFTVVTVIARRSARLAHLASAASSKQFHIHPLCLDYHDDSALRSGLAQVIQEHGPIKLVAAWIHSKTLSVSMTIAETLAPSKVDCRYFEIVGSAAADPARMAEDRSQRFERFSFIQYRQIVLGFVVEQKRSRWLTNDEISMGVIEAIAKDKNYSIVGIVRPWSARP